MSLNPMIEGPDFRRIERAILYLAENATRQPRLAEVAAGVGLSPYHFQRLFTRWAGVSPKRFLQYLTVSHAKDLLRDSRTVLETALEAGLSGPGRLHDHFVTIESVTPGEFKTRGEGLTIRYGVHPTPFGDCLLATTPRGICSLRFLGEGGSGGARADLERDWPRALLREDPGSTARYVERIFAGAPDRGEPERFPLYLRGTRFQLKVWEALLRIPEGRLVSYGGLARRLGGASRARAVGSAVGRNPVAVLIPCHRVIRATGDLGGYLYGTARKHALIAWEAARRTSPRTSLAPPGAGSRPRP